MRAFHCSAIQTKILLPGYGMPELAADFRKVCGAALLRLWKRSQAAAQYVCNVLDTGNEYLKPLLDQHAAADSDIPAPPPPAPLPVEDPSDAFWLSGHEVKDLLIIRVAIPAEPDVAAGGGGGSRRISSVQSLVGGGVKRKAGTAAYVSGKRRRSDEDLLSELTEKNQKYLAQMLVFICMGEDCDPFSANGPPGEAVAGQGEDPGRPAADDGADGQQPQEAVEAKQEAADPDGGPADNGGEQDAPKTTKRNSRDRWTQVSSRSGLSLNQMAVERRGGCTQHATGLGPILAYEGVRVLICQGVTFELLIRA